MPDTLTQPAAVKVTAEDDNSITLAGWAVYFGTEDLYGETFTKDTDFWFKALGSRKPFLMDHSLDDAIKSDILGYADLTPTDEGIWFEAQLEKSNRYVEHIGKLAQKGKLGASTGAVAHLVRIEEAQGGRFIRSWPIAELSATVTPAEKKTLGVSQLRSLLAAVAALKDLPPEVTPVGATAQVDATKAADPLLPTDSTKTKEPNVPEAATLTVDATDFAALKADFTALMALVKNEPAIKSAGYDVPNIRVHKAGQEANPAYKAFEINMRSKSRQTDDPAVRAALVEATGGNGGIYLVPVEYSNELITAKYNLSYLRRAGAQIMTMTGGEPFHLPALTASAAAVLTAEGAAYTETEPTITDIAFTPYKYTRLSKASEELVADSRFNVWGQILQPDFAQSFAAAENTAFTVGTGSGQPQGVVTGATVGITSAAVGAVTAAEVMALFFALDYKYRDNAKWMMNDATLGAISGLTDTTGRFLLQPGLDGSPGGLFMGKQLITNNSMATMAATAKTILFGDFSYYRIADWSSLALQTLWELYAANGYVGYRAFNRFDGHVVLPAAIQALQMHA